MPLLGEYQQNLLPNQNKNIYTKAAKKIILLLNVQCDVHQRQSAKQTTKTERNLTLLYS